MADYVSMKEYAEIHGVNIETLKARVKRKQIPHIRVGKSVMIDKNTPWQERKKTGRRKKLEQALIEAEKIAKSKVLTVKITRAYYISVEDASGKELMSDFTFLDKAEAEKIGARMKKKVEDKL